jgi:hypothetical protein
LALLFAAMAHIKHPRSCDPSVKTLKMKTKDERIGSWPIEKRGRFMAVGISKESTST